MKKTLYPNAKINLGLNIVGRNEKTGYHYLDMIMAPISLCDTLEVNATGKKGDIKLSSNKPDIPLDEKNIIVKIYKMYYNTDNTDSEELLCHLEKKIPHEAGLGGGSADGGFMLNLLNELHGNRYTDSELCEMGKEIGADIPFFIRNTTSRVKGIGEQITPIANNLDIDIIVVKPRFGVSTKEAYENFHKLSEKRDANIDMIIQGLAESDLGKVERAIENHLEQALLINNRDIIDFRKTLDKIPNHRFFMSGSGSAYFTLLPSHEDTSHKIEVVKSFQTQLNNCEVYLCNFL